MKKSNLDSESSTKDKKKPKLSWRSKVMALLVISLVAVTSVFYFYYASTQQELEQARQLQEFSETLKQEKQNCSRTLSQREGEFGQYEYCTRLINTFN